MQITDLIPPEMKKISLIGTSKNAGKTTIFNRLLQEWKEEGHAVGLVSAGVDGEKFDVWSGLPKPAIRPYPGTYVVTTLQALRDSSARFRILEKLSESSIGQEVYLAKTIEEGEVKLLGTPSLRLLERVMATFQQVGTKVNLIDGAYNRTASANPTLSDGFLLAVGAADHASLNDLIREVERWLTPYRFPLYPAEDYSLSGTTIFIEGACTSSRLAELMRMNPIPHLVIQDPTKWFVPPEEWELFRKRGGKVWNLEKPAFLGIGVNPFTPGGETWDGEEMLFRVKALCPDIPVFDIHRNRILV